MGEYYIKARGIDPAQVLRVAMPVKSVLSRSEFDDLAAKVRRFTATGSKPWLWLGVRRMQWNATPLPVP